MAEVLGRVGTADDAARPAVVRAAAIAGLGVVAALRPPFRFAGLGRDANAGRQSCSGTPGA